MYEFLADLTHRTTQPMQSGDAVNAGIIVNHGECSSSHSYCH